MKKRAPAATRFLNEFTRAIIEDRARKHLIPIEIKPFALRKKLMQMQKETATLEQKIEPQAYKKPLAKPFPTPKIITKTTTITKQTTAAKPAKPSYPKIQQTQAQQITTVSGLSLINPLLSDPSVRGLECIGPSKPVLINKAGLIQTTNISLTTDEINIFMHEVSERTRIPLTQGLFKAVMGNLIITAVISDIIGTRFVIQKRYLPLPPPPRF